MASKYSIQAVFKLIDNVSAPLDRIAGKGNKVGRALKNDFISAQKTIDNVGASLKKFGGYAVAAGAAAVGAGLAVATKQFVEFDNALHMTVWAGYMATRSVDPCPNCGVDKTAQRRNAPPAVFRSLARLKRAYIYSPVICRCLFCDYCFL